MFKAKQYISDIFTNDQIRSILFLEILLGIILSLVSLVLFSFITNAVLLKETVLFDNSISNLIISYREFWLTQVMLFLSLLGNELLIFGSVIIIIFLTLRKHHRESFVFSILLFMSATITTLLKILYQVPRPYDLALVYESSYSYPSGHALNSFVFYSTLSYFIYHFTKSRTISALVSALATMVIALVGISRIYLGVHRPSDVIAGFIAGFWIFTTTILIDKTIAFFRLMRESATKVN